MVQASKDELLNGLKLLQACSIDGKEIDFQIIIASIEQLQKAKNNEFYPTHFVMQ